MKEYIFDYNNATIKPINLTMKTYTRKDETPNCAKCISQCYIYYCRVKGKKAIRKGIKCRQYERMEFIEVKDK